MQILSSFTVAQLHHSELLVCPFLSQHYCIPRLSSNSPHHPFPKALTFHPPHFYIFPAISQYVIFRSISDQNPAVVGDCLAWDDRYMWIESGERVEDRFVPSLPSPSWYSFVLGKYGGDSKRAVRYRILRLRAYANWRICPRALR